MYGILYVSYKNNKLLLFNPGTQHISSCGFILEEVKPMVTHTKSVHLYGCPNLNKRQQLQKIEKSFNKVVM